MSDNKKTDEFDLLAVLAHGKLASKAKRELPPIHMWTAEFCEALNFLEYKETIQFQLTDTLLARLSKKEEELKDFFLDLPPVTCIYLYSDLPVNFTRFAGTMIVRDATHVQACLNSMKKGLGLMQGFRQDLELYSSGIEEATLAQLKKLTQMLALSTYFDPNYLNTESKREQSKNFDVLNEILQNANDKVIKTGPDLTGTVEVWSKKDSLTLSYYEDKGFLLKDFLAVSSLGNSGNIAQCENTTGHKGTGFKGVYQWFSRVEIRSNGVLCVLDDSLQLDYEDIFDGDSIKSNIPFKEKAAYGGHYPIPIFTECEMVHPKKTVISFFYRTDDRAALPCENPISENFFSESTAYYFLRNIDVFLLHDTNLQPVTKTLDRRNQIKENFYDYTYEFKVDTDGTLEDKTLSTNLPKRLEGRTIPPEKRSLTILFPKSVPQDIPRYNLFVDLPVSECDLFHGKFYANAPLFELTDNRRNITENPWNIRLKDFVCWCVYLGIQDLAHKEAHFWKYAYRYFPFHHFRNYEIFWNLPTKKEVKFIPYVFGSENLEHGEKAEHLCSIAQIQKFEVDLLPYYMYEAIGRSKMPYYHVQGFVYYPKDLDFFDVFYEYFNNHLATDETLFYRWALAQLGVVMHALVLTAQLLDALKQKNPTDIPVISQFEEDVQTFFGGERPEMFELPSHKVYKFNQYAYNNCFTNQRNQLYFTVSGDSKQLVAPHDKLLSAVAEQDSFDILCQRQQEEFSDFPPEGESLEGDDLIALKELVNHEKIVVKTTDDSCQILSSDMYWTETPFLKSKKIFTISDKTSQETVNASCFRDVSTKLDEKQPWKPEFFDILDGYHQYVKQKKEIPAFSFAFTTLSPLSPWILQLCENNIPSKLLDATLDPTVTTLVSQLNMNMDTIRSILTNKVMIYPRADGSKHRWTYGYLENNETPYLVLFGERSIVKLMREFFGIEHFSMTRHFTTMDCLHPVLQFAKWSEYTSDFSSHFRKKPDFQTADGKTITKHLLIHHYEYELNGEFYRFKGYGLNKICPICQAKLMIEQTQLHLRAVRLAKEETWDYWTEILCCDNCLNTFSYAEQVYLCPRDQEKQDFSTFTAEKMRASLERSDELTLCFQLSNGEMMSCPTTVTPLHRNWMLDELAKQEG